MYVGEHPFGLYALPSLVDQSVATVNHLNYGALLIEGPNEAASVGNIGDSAHHKSEGTNLKDLQNSLDNVLPSRKDIDVTPSYPLIILGMILLRFSYLSVVNVDFIVSTLHFSQDIIKLPPTVKQLCLVDRKQVQ